MKERDIYMLIVFVFVPLVFLYGMWLKYDELMAIGYLLPMVVALPIGIFLSYLIYIRGIYDGELFKNK